MYYGSENMTLTDASCRFPAEAARVASTISGFEHAILAAGTGDFTLDASGFSGSAILQGGTGDDTLIGGAPTPSKAARATTPWSAGANDTFAFNSASSGSQTVYEPPGGGVAGLDFSQAPAGVSINLSLPPPRP